MRVEDTNARTDDETGTLTVPSKILPPRSAPRKNHKSQSHSVSPPCRTPPAPLHGQAAGAKESVYGKGV